MRRPRSGRVVTIAAAVMLIAAVSSCSDDRAPTGHRSTTSTRSAPSTTTRGGRVADAIGPTRCTFPEGFYNSMRVDSLPVLPRSAAYVAGLAAESNWPKDATKPRVLRPMADDEQADLSNGERMQQGIPVNYLAAGFPTATVKPSPG